MITKERFHDYGITLSECTLQNEMTKIQSPIEAIPNKPVRTTDRQPDAYVNYF